MRSNRVCSPAQHSYRNAVVGGALALAVGFAPAALAGVWEYESTVSGNARYNDNPALFTKAELESAGAPDAYSTLATAEGEFRFIEPNSDIVIVPKIVGEFFLDDFYKDANSIDYFLRMSSNRTNRLTAFGTNLSYDNQSVRSAEDTDPNDPNSGGNSDFRNVVDDRRQRLSFAPSFSWTPTRQDVFNLTASVSATRHEKEFTPRADFEAASVAFQYQHSLSQRQSVGVSATGYLSQSTNKRRFCLGVFDLFPRSCVAADAGDPTVQIIFSQQDIDAEGYSLSGTYSYAWSENTRLTARIGSQTTTQDSLNVFFTMPEILLPSTFKFSSTDYLLGFNQNLQRLRYEINLSRNVQPGSDGAPSDKTQIQGSLTWRFTEKLVTNLAAVAYQQKSNPSGGITRENEFVRVDATLSWRLSRAYSVAALYTFRNRDPQISGDPLANDNAKRTSNAVTLSLRYTFD